MKMFLKIFMKIMGVIEWIVIIFIGLILLVFLIMLANDIIVTTQQTNLGKVMIKTINGKEISLKVPIKPIGRKDRKKGSQLHRYNLTVEKIWGGSWFLSIIPQEKRLFLTASYMGIFSVFILDYAITDPEAEKALLAHLKTIEPERIIK